jgi:hypothetical protein
VLQSTLKSIVLIIRLYYSVTQNMMVVPHWLCRQSLVLSYLPLKLLNKSSMFRLFTRVTTLFQDQRNSCVRVKACSGYSERQFLQKVLMGHGRDPVSHWLMWILFACFPVYVNHEKMKKNNLKCVEWPHDTNPCFICYVQYTLFYLALALHFFIYFSSLL